MRRYVKNVTPAGDVFLASITEDIEGGRERFIHSTRVISAGGLQARNVFAVYFTKEERDNIHTLALFFPLALDTSILEILPAKCA